MKSPLVGWYHCRVRDPVISYKLLKVFVKDERRLVDVMLVWFPRQRYIIKQNAMIRCKDWLAFQRGRLGVQRRSSAYALSVMECVRWRCVFSIRGYVFWGMSTNGPSPAAARWRLVSQRSDVGGKEGKGRSGVI